MIVLPTKRRLERRRESLYRYLMSLHCASIHQVEDIMRKIHIINLKLKIYFKRKEQYEAGEFFEDKDTFETEDPTFVQIEEALREIEI